MGSGTSGRIALFAATSLASFATPAAAYAGQERQFNVREQPAITGIPDFARQADVQIMVPQSATVGERTRAVNGRMAVDEGLARLIKGTSLAIRSNDGQTIALARKNKVAARPAENRVVRLSAPTADPVVSAGSATPPESPPQDIVVTARRRNETLQSAPVAVTVVGGAELDRRALASFDNLVQAVPQLVVAPAAGSIQGGLVLIRGVGAGDSNPFADQAVSFNVDGVQVARASIRRMAEMDMQQIEVLKGPQALFFGKNSPGGVISVKTADPGEFFESKVDLAYEGVGKELRGMAYVSGPLSSTFGARLAVFGSRLSGWVDNEAADVPIYGPWRKSLPYDREFGGRLTLKLEPSDRFNARLKFNYGKLKTAGAEENNQLVDCPYGVSQVGGITDCRPDDKIILAAIGPSFGQLDSRFGSDHSYLKQRQMLFSGELNYDLTDEITLTSLTGYYDVDLDWQFSFSQANSTRPDLFAASYSMFKIKELSEEIRLATNFSGAFNFLTGVHLQSSRADYGTNSVRNALNPAFVLPWSSFRQKGEAFSVFFQGVVDVTPTLELSAGGRYSYEKKRFAAFNSVGDQLTVAKPEDSWEDFSPEATLTYRPSRQLTVYGSYKRGFLSGGFNGGAGGSLVADRSYDQQKIRGFEGGIKATLLDNRLSANLALYNYQILGLQVSSVINADTSPTLIVTNAGKARTKGVELDVNFEATDRLRLRGAVAYNHARYVRFNASCYGGQTVALGCNILPTAGIFRGQDLAGEPLTRAPDWSIITGFSYRYPIGNGQRLEFSGDANYTSHYFAAANNSPGSKVEGYWLIGGDITFRDEDRGYSVSLIGRNLTNKYYFWRSTDTSFTGSGAGTSLPTARIADTGATVSRGREIMVRLTVQLDQLFR